MADMKKQDMAEAAEQLLVGTGWLPALMRTPRAAQETRTPAGGCRHGDERLTRTLSPPSKRQGRDRVSGPGSSSCDCRNFWPRAIGRAANLMILTPSTGCIL